MTSNWKKPLSIGYWTLMALWLAFWPMHALAQAIDLPPSTVSTNALWLIVYGLIVSLITSGITNLPPNFTTWQKRGIAAVLSAILAAVTLGYAGQLDTTDFARTWLVIFIAASGIYTVLSRPIADAVSRNPQT